MVVSPTYKGIFIIIIFLIIFHNIVSANQNIIINISPSNIYLYETTTFDIELTSSQNLSSLIMHFYIDNEKIGTKKIIKIEKNKKILLNFDYYNKNSYIGEHYIELQIEYVTENHEKKTENLYSVVNIKKAPFFRENLTYIFIGLFFIVLFGSFVHFEIVNKSIIEFDRNDRNIIFGFIVTMLPISISLFSLYISQKQELKTGMLLILIDFIVSLIIALFMFVVAQRWSETDANNFAFYSICFLLLGLTKMVFLVFVT